METNSSSAKFEVIQRYLETKNEEAILACLERLNEKKKTIGKGHNAEVFVAENEPILEKLCVKKMHKYPKVKINTVDEEFEFQEKANEIGVRTPRNVMWIRNTETNEEYMIMERIDGYSIGDLLHEKSMIDLTPQYNHEKFFEELKLMVDKLHQNRIYHRDLHSGNVMITVDGHPVIIDFGAATFGYGEEDDIYRANGFVLTNSENGSYSMANNMLLKDEIQVNGLETRMRSYQRRLTEIHK